MPIEFTDHDAHEADGSSVDEGSVDELLFVDEDTLTPVGEVVADFLESADFSDFFEDENLAGLIDVELNEDDEEGDEILDGEIVAESVDEADLLGMFDYYVENVLEADESFEGRVRLQSLYSALGLDEAKGPFRKGEFRDIRTYDPNVVNRMLGAMIAKGAIRRVKRETGYKGGDYERSSGYAPGKGKIGSAAARSAAWQKMNKTGKISFKDSLRPGFGSRNRWANHKLKNAAKGRMLSKEKRKSLVISGGKRLKSTQQAVADQRKNTANKAKLKSMPRLRVTPDARKTAAVAASRVARAGTKGKTAQKLTGSRLASAQAKKGGFNSVAQMRASKRTSEDANYEQYDGAFDEVSTAEAGSLEEAHTNALYQLARRQSANEAFAQSFVNED